jgi:CheY-like chemotaxis protein
VSFNASVFRDPEGNVRGIFAVARDVTEQRRLEEQIREQQNYSRGLIEASVDRERADPHLPRAVPGPERDVLETIAALLKAAGHHVFGAASGPDGLARAAAERPDIILVDYTMPGMDGLETTRGLKTQSATRAIPVVALTAAMSSRVKALMQAGCIAFIPKPIDPATFARQVEDFLQATVARRRPGD